MNNKNLKLRMTRLNEKLQEIDANIALGKTIQSAPVYSMIEAWMKAKSAKAKRAKLPAILTELEMHPEYQINYIPTCGSYMEHFQCVFLGTFYEDVWDFSDDLSSLIKSREHYQEGKEFLENYLKTYDSELDKAYRALADLPDDENPDYVYGIMRTRWTRDDEEDENEIHELANEFGVFPTQRKAKKALLDHIANKSALLPRWDYYIMFNHDKDSISLHYIFFTGECEDPENIYKVIAIPVHR